MERMKRTLEPREIQKHESSGPYNRRRSENMKAADRTTAGNPKTTVMRPE
jgi:hypothetical protein